MMTRADTELSRTRGTVSNANAHGDTEVLSTQFVRTAG